MTDANRPTPIFTQCDVWEVCDVVCIVLSLFLNLTPSTKIESFHPGLKL